VRFSDLSPEPEIHCRRGKQQGGKGRIPGAVKNVARDDEKILSQIPTAQTPIESRDDDVENDEGQRIKKHDDPFGFMRSTATTHLRQAYWQNVLEVVAITRKTYAQKFGHIPTSAFLKIAQPFKAGILVACVGVPRGTKEQLCRP
jgi:hypothetical protein